MKKFKRAMLTLFALIFIMLIGAFSAVSASADDNDFTVYFEDEYSNYYGKQAGTIGDEIVFPEIPQEDWPELATGYNWKYSNGQSVPGIMQKRDMTGWDDEKVVANDDSTYYFAFYDFPVHTITWNLGEGDTITQRAVTGYSFDVPAPVKNGYGFAKWLPEIPAVMPNEDISFDAVWIKSGLPEDKNAPVYTINYYFMNADGQYNDTPDAVGNFKCADSLVNAMNRVFENKDSMFHKNYFKSSSMSDPDLGEGGSPYEYNMYYPRERVYIQLIEMLNTFNNSDTVNPHGFEPVLAGFSGLHFAMPRTTYMVWTGSFYYSNPYPDFLNGTFPEPELRTGTYDKTYDLTLKDSYNPMVSSDMFYGYGSMDGGINPYRIIKGDNTLVFSHDIWSLPCDWYDDSYWDEYHENWEMNCDYWDNCISTQWNFHIKNAEPAYSPKDRVDIYHDSSNITQLKNFNIYKKNDNGDFVKIYNTSTFDIGEQYYSTDWRYGDGAGSYFPIELNWVEDYYVRSNGDYIPVGTAFNRNTTYYTKNSDGTFSAIDKSKDRYPALWMRLIYEKIYDKNGNQIYDITDNVEEEIKVPYGDGQHTWSNYNIMREGILVPVKPLSIRNVDNDPEGILDNRVIRYYAECIGSDEHGNLIYSDSYLNSEGKLEMDPVKSKGYVSTLSYRDDENTLHTYWLEYPQMFADLQPDKEQILSEKNEYDKGLFCGWKCGDNYVSKDSDVWKIDYNKVADSSNGDTTVSAILVNCKIDYYKDGNKITSSGMIEPGATVNLGNGPEVDGYNFAGWTDENGHVYSSSLTMDDDLLGWTSNRRAPLSENEKLALVRQKTVNGLYNPVVKLFAKYEPQGLTAYTLKINYVMSDGSTPPEAFEDMFLRNDEYSIVSPSVTGYAPDVAVVSGTLTENTTVTVTYSPVNCPLRINYVMSDGSTAPAAHEQFVKYNAQYSVASPSVTGYTPNTPTVSGTMTSVGGKTEEVTYNPNPHTITYNLAGGTIDGNEDPVITPTYFGQPVTPPQNPVKPGWRFTGWSPEIALSVPDENLEYTAQWEHVPYTLTITYSMSDNNDTLKPANYTEIKYYGDSYSVTSPVIEGYEADTTVVSGVMPEENVNITVNYVPVNASLTITYKYENGEDAAPVYSENLNFGNPYNVVSPTIPGYTPDKETVSGTMGSGPVNEVVTYSANTYNLTVNYTMSDGSAAPSAHTETVRYGSSYSVASPSVTGYTPDTETVSGVFEQTEDLEVTVTYNINYYTLTINYSSEDGEGLLPATHIENIAYRESYSVVSDDIDGYTPDSATVEGVMPAENVSVDVTYYLNSYNVKWIVDENERNESVKFKAMPSGIGTPEKLGFTFAGWEPEVIAQPSHDMEYTAKFDKNSYSFRVNYVIDEDGYGAYIEPTFETTLEFGEDFSKESPVVVGYTPDKETVFVNHIGQNFEETVTYSRNSHTITWTDGNNDYTEDVKYGDTITPPGDSGQYGHHFDDWTPSVPNTVPDDDLHFYAVYEANSYPATFISNGETFKTIPVTFGDNIPDPGVPESEGNDFCGWAEEENGAALLNLGVMDKEGGRTFYAVWTPSGAHYNIETYYMNEAGEYPDTPDTIKPVSSFVGDGVSVSPEEVEGFSVDDTKSILTGNVPPSGVLVLKIYYSRSKYTINYLYGYETENTPVSQQYYYNQTITDVPSYERTGYTFNGFSPSVPDKMPAADIDVTAQWDNKDVPVKFMEDDKKINSTETETAVFFETTVKYGDSIEEPSGIPESTGKTFKGWSRTYGATVPDTELGVADNEDGVTFYPVFSTNEYTVTIHYVYEDGSEAAPDYTDTFGAYSYASVTTPYIGDSFYPDKIEVPFSVTDSDLEFTVTFHPYLITVNYNYSRNGGTGMSASETSSVPLGSSVDLTPSANKDKWEFIGWNTDPDATEGLASLTASSDSLEDITVYAIYRRVFECHWFTVTSDGNAVYDPDGTWSVTESWGDITIYNNVQSVNLADSGMVVNPFSLVRCENQAAFIAFTELDENGNATNNVADLTKGAVIPADSDKTVWNFGAVYGYVTTIRTDANGADIDILPKVCDNYAVVETSEQQDVHIYARRVFMPEITYAGHVLTGWEDTDTGDTIPTDGFVVSNRDYNLKAKWENAEYTITYLDDNGEVLKTETYPYNSEIVSYVPEKAGVIFAGWDADVPERMPAENLVFIASWSSESIHVTYHSNTEAVADTPVDSTNYIAGNEVTVLNPQYQPNTDGKFAGWNTDENGNGIHYNPGDKFIIEKDTDLYAMWVKVSKAAEKAGETLLPGDEIIYTISFKPAEPVPSVTITDTIPENTTLIQEEESAYNYENGILTWILNDVNTENTYTLTFKVRINENTPPETVIINLANIEYNGMEVPIGGSEDSDNPCTIITDAYYTLVYDANGGEGNVPVDNEVYCSSKNAVIKDGSEIGKDGYIFAGWNTDKDGKGKHFNPGESAAIEEDTVLYAQWLMFKKTSSFDGVFNPGTPVRYTITISIPDNTVGVYISDVIPEGLEVTDPGQGILSEEGVISWTFSDAYNAGTTIEVVFMAKVRDTYTDGTEVKPGDTIVNKAKAEYNGGEYISESVSNEIGGYKIIYKSDIDEANVPVDNNSYTPGSYAGIMSADGMNGGEYVFAGWMDRQGNLYKAGDSVIVNDNITLSAQWGMVVKTAGNSTTGFKKDDIVKYTIKATVPAGVSAVITDKLASSFAFVEQNSEGIASPDAAFTFSSEDNTCKWTVQSENVKQEITITLTAKIISDDVSSGKLSNEATIRFGSGYEYSSSAEDIKLGYTITYIDGSNEFKDDKIYASGSDAVIMNNMFKKDGYEFTGWTETNSLNSGKTYKGGDKVTVNGNLIFHANWKQIEPQKQPENNTPVIKPSTYRIYYIANGAQGTVPVDNTEYEAGATAILKSAQSLKLDGYIFKEWNTKPDGTGSGYRENSSIKVTGETTLYAIFTKVTVTERVNNVVEKVAEAVIPETGRPTAVISIFISAMIAAAAIIIILKKEKKNK